MMACLTATAAEILQMNDDYTITPVSELRAKVNPQIYSNSPMLGSSIEKEVAESPTGFFNAKDPNLAVLHEKPEHRLIILLKAQGYSNVEIARLTGYTNPWIGQVLRQPWAKKRLVDEINLAGRDAVQEILSGAAVDSVFKIIELRDRASDEAVQGRMAQDLLDRYLGKATQRVESRSEVKHISGDIEDVNKALAELEAQERTLLGLPTTGTASGLSPTSLEVTDTHCPTDANAGANTKEG